MTFVSIRPIAIRINDNEKLLLKHHALQIDEVAGKVKASHESTKRKINIYSITKKKIVNFTKNKNC